MLSRATAIRLNTALSAKDLGENRSLVAQNGAHLACNQGRSSSVPPHRQWLLIARTGVSLPTLYLSLRIFTDS